MGEQREVIGLHHKHGCVYGLFFGVTNATALSETNYWRFNCVNSLMFLLVFFGGGVSGNGTDHRNTLSFHEFMLLIP